MGRLNSLRWFLFCLAACGVLAGIGRFQESRELSAQHQRQPWLRRVVTRMQMKLFPPRPKQKSRKRPTHVEPIITDQPKTAFQQIIGEPQSHSNRGFHMKPVLVDGKIIGMRVRISNPEHPLAKIGLRTGDVVLELNEVPITGPESLSNIYRVMRESDELRFLVERNGLVQTFGVNRLSTNYPVY